MNPYDEIDKQQKKLEEVQEDYRKGSIAMKKWATARAHLIHMKLQNLIEKELE